MAFVEYFVLNCCVQMITHISGSL